MNKHPVGPKTIERASKTEAGKLAKLLNRLLYCSDYQEVAMKGFAQEKFDIVKKRYVIEDLIYRNEDALPCGIPAAGTGGSYVEPGRLLLAIRDHLEAAAIREVCD